MQTPVVEHFDPSKLVDQMVLNWLPNDEIVGDEWAERFKVKNSKSTVAGCAVTFASPLSSGRKLNYRHRWFSFHLELGTQPAEGEE